MANEAELRIMVAIMEADRKFQDSGESGTKTWLRDYLGPALAAHKLRIVDENNNELAPAGLTNAEEFTPSADDELLSLLHTFERAVYHKSVADWASAYGNSEPDREAPKELELARNLLIEFVTKVKTQQRGRGINERILTQEDLDILGRGR